MLGFVAEKDPNSSGDEETDASPLRKRPQIYPLEQKTIDCDTLPTKPTVSQIHSNVSSEIVIVNQLTEENELKSEQEKGWRFLEKYLIKENWEDIVECVRTVDNGGPPPDLKDSDISRDTLFVYFELLVTNSISNSNTYLKANFKLGLKTKAISTFAYPCPSVSKSSLKKCVVSRFSYHSKPNLSPSSSTFLNLA